MAAKEAQNGKVSGKPSRTYYVGADRLLPDMSDADLRKLLKKLSGRKDTAKKANMIRAVIKKREGKSSYMTAKELGMADQTLRGWLVWIAERGLDGLNDRRIVKAARMRNLLSRGIQYTVLRIQLALTTHLKQKTRTG